MLQFERFRTEINADRQVTVLTLSGELDLISEPGFYQTLAEVLAIKPRQIVVDVTDAAFISAAGYEAIGRCGAAVELLTLCSRSRLAQTVLESFGYRTISYVVLDHSHFDRYRDWLHREKNVYR